MNVKSNNISFAVDGHDDKFPVAVCFFSSNADSVVFQFVKPWCNTVLLQSKVLDVVRKVQPVPALTVHFSRSSSDSIYCDGTWAMF